MEFTTSGPVVFTKFPSLPAELRLKIWHHFLRPRIIHITLDPNYAYPSFTSPRPAVSNGDLPPLFSVNRESRQEALHYYRNTILIQGITKQPFYFNPELDTLDVNSSGNPHACILFLRHLAINYPRSKVRSLALDDPSFSCICFADAMGQWTRLERLFFIGKTGVSHECWNIHQVYTYQSNKEQAGNDSITALVEKLEKTNIQGTKEEERGFLGKSTEKNSFVNRYSHKRLANDFNLRKYSWLGGRRIEVKAVSLIFWKEKGLKLIE